MQINKILCTIISFYFKAIYEKKKQILKIKYLALKIYKLNKILFI
jgi:hypothetical protein